jgi:hypothetical protein
VPGWHQDDFRHFWGKVIEEFVESIRMMDGWQYSSGACYEYYIAVKEGIPAADQRGIPISPEDAGNSIGRALTRMQSTATDVAFLERVRREIVNLCRPNPTNMNRT